jgi:phosphoglycerol transferase MdoB-like AlkP superfamily enzyme
VRAAPGFHLILVVICAIGFVERVAAALHGDGLGGSGWAWASAAVMLAGVAVYGRSYVLARRARGARAAALAAVTS